LTNLEALLHKFRMETNTLGEKKLFEEFSPKKDVEQIEEEFSEDEANHLFRDIQPIKEEEIDTFQNFLKKNNIILGQISRKKILFDPEME